MGDGGDGVKIVKDFAVCVGDTSVVATPQRDAKRQGTVQGGATGGTSKRHQQKAPAMMILSSMATHAEPRTDEDFKVSEFVEVKFKGSGWARGQILRINRCKESGIIYTVVFSGENLGSNRT